MDIGVPFRDLGPIDVAAAAEHVKSLGEEAWAENTFRQDVLADSAHSVTKSILFRHEWRRWENVWGVNTLEELIEKWAARENLDSAPFMPIKREETDEGPVYTFPDWSSHEAVLGPLVERAIEYLRTSTGIVTRLALVMLPPGAYIKPHDDGQHMAHKAHRLHVPLTPSPGNTARERSRARCLNLLNQLLADGDSLVLGQFVHSPPCPRSPLVFFGLFQRGRDPGFKEVNQRHDIRVVNGLQPDNLARALRGEPVGTRIYSSRGSAAVESAR